MTDSGGLTEPLAVEVDELSWDELVSDSSQPPEMIKKYARALGFDALLQFGVRQLKPLALRFGWSSELQGYSKRVLTPIFLSWVFGDEKTPDGASTSSASQSSSSSSSSSSSAPVLGASAGSSSSAVSHSSVSSCSSTATASSESKAQEVPADLLDGLRRLLAVNSGTQLAPVTPPTRARTSTPPVLVHASQPEDAGFIIHDVPELDPTGEPQPHLDAGGSMVEAYNRIFADFTSMVAWARVQDMAPRNYMELKFLASLADTMAEDGQGGSRGFTLVMRRIGVLQHVAKTGSWDAADFLMGQPRDQIIPQAFVQTAMRRAALHRRVYPNSSQRRGRGQRQLNSQQRHYQQWPQQQPQQQPQQHQQQHNRGRGRGRGGAARR